MTGRLPFDPVYDGDMPEDDTLVELVDAAREVAAYYVAGYTPACMRRLRAALEPYDDRGEA